MKYTAADFICTLLGAVFGAVALWTIVSCMRWIVGSAGPAPSQKIAPVAAQEDPLELTWTNSTWKRPSKTFTNTEWQALTKDDEVVAFLKEVNAAAVAKPYWSEDFRRAFYDATHEVYSKRMVDKYNNGEAFMIEGEPK